MLFLSKLFYLLAFLLGSFLIWRAGREHDFDEEKILDWVIFGTLISLIGARLVHVGFNLVDYVSASRSILTNLRSILTLSDGGLNFEGGIFTFLLFTFALFRRWHWPLLPPLDFFALGASLAQFIILAGWLFASINFKSYLPFTNYHLLFISFFTFTFLLFTYHRHYQKGRILSVYLLSTLKPLLCLTGMVVFFRLEGRKIILEFVAGFKEGLQHREVLRNTEKVSL